MVLHRRNRIRVRLFFRKSESLRPDSISLRKGRACFRLRAEREPETIMRMLHSIAILLCTVLASGVAASASSRDRPQFSSDEQQFADLGDLKLDNGGVIRNFRLGYRTAGNLNAEKSNAILWPSWLGGKSEDLAQYAGPNNVIDTEKYFAIFVDSIGNGISTSPSNSPMQPRLKFPEFTIRDMVESEYRLATEVFHLEHLHAVIGISMGGMQAFEWAVAHPHFMDEVITLAGSPQTTSYDKLLWMTQIDALHLDPEWRDGNGTKPMSSGLLLYNEIGSMSLTTPTYRVEHTPTKDFESFRESLRKQSGNAASACDAIRQRGAILALDIPQEYGSTMEQVAKRVRAKMLVFISPEDHTVNPAPALEFANFAGAPVITLDSVCGHQSTACISLGPLVARFLAAPQSVASETLHDAEIK
jgi:homoserine O-acetyltransferase/O-succinyltransferase